jgi:hypothetical protein
MKAVRRTSTPAVLAVVSLLLLIPLPASATEAAGPGGVTIDTSYTMCTTYVDFTLQYRTQVIEAFKPGVTSSKLMPSTSVRWTARLQYAAIGGTTWTTWQGMDRSQWGYVLGLDSFYVDFPSTASWNINVAAGVYQFRVVHIVQFFDSSGRAIPGSTWVLDDLRSTRLWLTGLGLGNDVDQIYWGKCSF